MSKPTERSPGGSTILRYAPRERPFEPAYEVPAHLALVEEHLARCFGPTITVFHELVSDLVHIDVHLIAPTSTRPCWTLFTTGMSARPMKVPEGAAGYEWAELVLQLPADWPLDTTPGGTITDEAAMWPIRTLKFLARFPHAYDTWLGFGHSLPNGDPAEPYVRGTKLCGALLLPPVSVPEELRGVPLPDGRTVHLYAVHFLTAEEMSFKLNRGTDALLELFDQHHVSEVLDPKRRSVVKRRLFGLL